MIPLIPNNLRHTQRVRIDVFPFIIVVIAGCVVCVVGQLVQNVFYVGIIQ